jgi:hypothetical protein
MSVPLTRPIHRIAALGAAIILAFGTLQQAAASEPSPTSSMSIEELKGVYLGCEEAAAASKLGGGDVMYCSQVYEELKQKAFGGDFRRIRSWLERRSMALG